MRTTKELFELLLEEREQNKKTFFPSECMCQLINHMKWSLSISFDEYAALKAYLSDNAPDFIKKVQKPPGVSINDFHWWERGDWTPRIKCIQEQITLLS